MGHPPRRIGLTGGIATGKSTVAHYLANRYQLPILDADLYAREAVATDSPILQRIFMRYGETIQNSDGTLNRQKLGDIIFSHPTEKSWLEQQIHPYVANCFQAELTKHPHEPVVCMIPLLIEAQLTDLVSEIWVVTCPPEQQLQRLQARNHLTQAQAQQRIQSQMPLAQKVAIADVVLDNSSDLATLQHQIDRAYQRSC